MKRRFLIAGLAALFIPFTVLTFAPGYAQEKGVREPDVIYVPTPNEVVDKMFELADIRPGEVVYDLGCGDGRIPILASKKYGVRSWGFDINPVRVKESLENVAKNKVGHLVTIKEQDIFELDISKADVITLYLLPRLNVKLIPQLDKLKPGCRIVSHDFDMAGVRPKREINVRPTDGSREHRVYLWVTPLEKEKTGN
jgi:tRNA A58 N-methylase Trm61